MKQLFLLVGIIIVSVKAGTITEEYLDDVRYAFNFSNVPQGKTHYKAVFNNLYTIETRTLNSTLMELQITAKTTGWVGIILNPNKTALAGGDILIAGIHDFSGQPYFTDMYGDADWELNTDTKSESDWIFVWGYQYGSELINETKLVFYRQYKTNDPNIGEDYVIKDEDHYFVAIMGQDDNQFPVLVSSEHRVGSCKVNFVKYGTGGENELVGGGPNGLTGSFHLIFLTTFSIIDFKLF